jgi:hypothetical protein
MLISARGSNPSCNIMSVCHGSVAFPQLQLPLFSFKSLLLACTILSQLVHGLLD